MPEVATPSSQSASAPGLIYVVGASGSGKDTLLAYARAHLDADAPVCFAHRYITRASEAGGENHVAMSVAEFQARKRAGLFAMDWTGNGLCYGIGIEIDLWRAKGSAVVLNGSREYLETARKLYPDLLPVLIEVPTDILRQRLLERGREDILTVERRLERHQELSHLPWQGERISNDGPVEKAGKSLIGLIRQGLRSARPCA